MPSYLHARGQLVAAHSSPDEGRVDFEGPEFEKFTHLWEQKLQEVVDRWEPHAAPVDRQAFQDQAERQR